MMSGSVIFQGVEEVVSICYITLEGALGVTQGVWVVHKKTIFALYNM